MSNKDNLVVHLKENLFEEGRGGQVSLKEVVESIRHDPRWVSVLDKLLFNKGVKDEGVRSFFVNELWNEVVYGGNIDELERRMNQYINFIDVQGKEIQANGCSVSAGVSQENQENDGGVVSDSRKQLGFRKFKPEKEFIDHNESLEGLIYFLNAFIFLFLGVKIVEVGGFASAHISRIEALAPGYVGYVGYSGFIGLFLVLVALIQVVFSAKKFYQLKLTKRYEYYIKLEGER